MRQRESKLTKCVCTPLHFPVPLALGWCHLTGFWPVGSCLILSLCQGDHGDHVFQMSGYKVGEHSPLESYVVLTGNKVVLVKFLRFLRFVFC